MEGRTAAAAWDGCLGCHAPPPTEASQTNVAAMMPQTPSDAAVSSLLSWASCFCFLPTATSAES